MKGKLVLLVSLLLLTGCVCTPAPVGTMNHSFTSDNATECSHDCLSLVSDHNCTSYTYIWNKTYPLEHCDCVVGGCFT